MSRRKRHAPGASGGSHRSRGGHNRFRIVGGQWRGRRFAFPDGEDLRPTGDRVRETLFNWLAPVVEGARCLDLFAGSGALGLEALSRGAASGLFVDLNPAACAAIDAHVETLGAGGAQTLVAAADSFLAGEPQPFDIVFLDPPFGSGCLPKLCTLLEHGGWLAPGARVYIECPVKAGSPTVPESWTVSRSGRAGNVGFFLCVRR